MGPEGGRAPVLLEIDLAADAQRWREASFATEGEGAPTVTLGRVRLRLRGPDAGRGILRWTLGGLADETAEHGEAAMHGLPTTASAESAPPPGPPQPNGVTAIDHVVAFSPDLERTVASLRAGGLDFRRLREGPTAAGAQRQAFFRVGEPLLEVIEHPPDVPAASNRDAPSRFWGLALLAPDLDATIAGLGPLLGDARPAIQPGRRIATFVLEAGLGLPVALISPPT